MPLSLKPTHDRRRPGRRPARLLAQVYTAVEDGIDVTVLDVSRDGFRFESELALAIGAEIVLSLPHAIAVRAIVRWEAAPEYGCEFIIPLTPSQQRLAEGGEGMFELRLINGGSR